MWPKRDAHQVKFFMCACQPCMAVKLVLSPVYILHTCKNVTSFLPFCIRVRGCISVCVCLCVHQLNWNRHLSIFLKLEICHPLRKSLSLVPVDPSDYLCQQYSSLFPACGCSYLDNLSWRRVKTQASMCGPPSSTQRGLSGGLCAVWCLQLWVKSVLTVTVNELKPSPEMTVWTDAHEYRRNNFGWTWRLSKLMKNQFFIFMRTKQAFMPRLARSIA